MDLNRNLLKLTDLVMHSKFVLLSHIFFRY